METVEEAKSQKKGSRPTSYQKNREKQAKKKLLNDFSVLFEKAKLLHVEKDVIFGALLCLAEGLSDAKLLGQYKEKSLQYHKQKSIRNPIIISFPNPPSQEIKSSLKKLKFKWNSFRKEFYGFGDIDFIKNMMSDVVCSIDTLEVD